MSKPLVLTVAAFLCFTHSAIAAVDQPNVIIVMTDDQGYGDFSSHGNPVLKTPNLDRLAAESVRFTDFHVDPTCAPTRTALLTGKYSHSVRVWHTIAAGNCLRESETTLADLFRAAGYETGLFGKWHLGANHPYRPIDRGFDVWLGHGDGGTGTTDDHFDNDRVNDVYLKNGRPERRDGFAPDVFFDAAIDFIRQQRDKPFFVYLPTYTPHGPHTIPDRTWVEPYSGKATLAEAYFFATITRLDENIGRLRSVLAEAGAAENTILLFLTDNGGTAGVKLFNAGMRGRKGSVYEGGHRVPLFVHWPAGELAHGQTVDELTAHIDVAPTLVELCGLQPPDDVTFDGRSFIEQLKDPTATTAARTLVVERQRTFLPNKWENATAMRGPWRLVDNQELYNIAKDPSQEHDCREQFPAVVQQLRDDFETYWQHVSPGDRDPVLFSLGHENDPEILLQSSDWYLPAVPWNHAQVAEGPSLCGHWNVRVEQAGEYRFEVRRWPREVDAPIAGVPTSERYPKPVDAWDAAGGKPYLIYANETSPYKALPVKRIRLTVGDVVVERALEAETTAEHFDIALQASPYQVTAELLDSAGERIAGAYYVYTYRKQNMSEFQSK